MNLIVLKGNLGDDPKIKTFDWGKTASFSLATSESYKNKAGERVTETDWHNVQFKGAVVDVIEKHLHKGDQVLITGKSKTRQYTKDGQQHWTTEVIGDTFEFCGVKKDSENQVQQKSGAMTREDILNLPDDRPTPEQIGNMPVAENTDDLPF